MKKTSFVVLCVLLMIAIFATVGNAAVTKGTLKFAHTEAEIDLLSTPYKALTATFKSVVEAQTNGRFIVQVYPNKQLGDLQDILTQCQRGVVHFTAGQNIANMAVIFPEAGLLEMPYAFVNTYVARILLDGPYGQGLSDRMAKATGVRPLVWLPSALRSFVNNAREIKSPADLKGLKIRVMPSPMFIEMIKAFGAQPTPIAWAELYTALQTGVVDGHEQAPYNLTMAKLDEVAKFYTLDNHVLNVMGFSVNEKFFQSLTPEDQEVMRVAAHQAQLAFLGIVQAKEPLDFAQLTKKGIKITALTGAQIEEFKKVAQPPAVKTFVGTLGQKTVDDFLAAVKKAEAESRK